MSFQIILTLKIMLFTQLLTKKNYIRLLRYTLILLFDELSNSVSLRCMSSLTHSVSFLSQFRPYTHGHVTT